MRAVLLMLLGLVIGVIATANVMSALSARNPMPKAVMATMNYHFGELKHALKATQCAAASSQLHLQRLQSTALDIVPVFGIPDRAFSDAARLLQTRLQQATQSAPADCAALAAAIRPIEQACKSCHQKYR